MKRVLCFVAGVMGVVLFLASNGPWSVDAMFQTAAPTVPLYTMQSTQYGVVAVNQTTGAITFCAGSTISPMSTLGQVPIGSCVLVGTIPPSKTSTNSFSMATNGASVFVMNNQTGQIAQCAGEGVIGSSGTSASVVASCKAPVKLN